MIVSVGRPSQGKGYINIEDEAAISILWGGRLLQQRFFCVTAKEGGLATI